MSKDKRKDDVIMNEMITAKEIRCTSDEGTNYGIISTAEALKIADELGLDLVLIVPDGKPPVAKIMDYGKFRYQLEKKKKVSQCQELGFIKFGSRVDLLLPIGTTINVRLNENVEGGVTIIATL